MNIQRRDFLRMGMGTLPFLNGNSVIQGQNRPYDLLIKAGRIIDPSQDLDIVADLAVSQGKVAALEPNLDPGRAARTVRVPGRLVTPGLIDLHVHGFQGISHWGIDLDRFCLARGVTTAVDAGTSGADSFDGFRRHVIEPAATRILAFVNIARIGLIGRPGELIDPRMIDVEAAVEAAEKHRDVVVGIKVRCSEALAGPNELEALKKARAAAEQIGKPLMMHVGQHYAPLEALLDQLRPGDMMTHSFRAPGDGGVVAAGGKVDPAIKRAADRGVLFDLGHGSGGFSFLAMEAALAENFLPSTISSDAHTYSVQGPVFDLPTTMSKLLHLGLSLNQVIELATLAPARALKREGELGSLKPGRTADITVLDLVEGSFPLHDSRGEVRQARRKIVPVLAFRDGSLEPGPGA